MMKSLPASWTVTILESVAAWGSGGTPSRKNKEYFRGNIPWIKTGELGDKYVRSSEEWISEKAIKNSSAKLFPKGSVGIAMYGVTIGKLSIWGIDASTNQACAVAQPYDEVLHNEYLYYFLMSEKRDLINVGKGGAQPNISQGILKSWNIRLAPLNEQKRIVAKIEELFSELDKGIESLKTAREQLKVYRQAVLKHAFEGKLTADWREENKDKLETADELLERIKQERESAYQQQLEEWKAAVKKWEQNGKEGKKPTKPRKPTNAILSDKNSWVDLPLLPEDWCWTTLSSITNEITDGDHQAPPQTTSGIPFIVISNIKNNKVDFSQTKFVPRNYYEAISNNRKPQQGDILYTVTGSFGIPALIDFEKEFCFQRHVGLIKPLITVLNRFLYYALQSPLVYAQAQAVATGTAQKTVPLSGLRNFSIPLVSPREQKEIIEKLDTVFSEIDSLEHEVKDQLQKSEALRQSILKQAFSGKLVTQDPNDEPASVLLERIKAEKENNKKKRNAA